MSCKRLYRFCRHSVQPNANRVDAIASGKRRDPNRNHAGAGHLDLFAGKRVAAITTEDVLMGAAIMLSVFIRDPEFQGQQT